MLELEFLINNKMIFPNINRNKIKILFSNLRNDWNFFRTK